MGQGSEIGRGQGIWPFQGSQTGPRYSCSFCGKSQDDVRKLIAGPKVYICDECIKLCSDIIAEDHREEARAKLAENGEASMFRFPTCFLCRAPSLPEDLFLIPERGPVCIACVGAIREATGRPPGAGGS